eukprot:CAMPEP_0173366250 /NCGR_PEP_ID=MMETSP1144-20121109/24114_1 /TAXON_ID=483371 /ORGANISM="non described non described, Strain CCMP2298" /LENGTH=55 /DNA_ID=CAMNT_0014316845 /DNA_START=47 /DNA_END=210 /DNA_ORIENTATION=+
MAPHQRGELSHLYSQTHTGTYMHAMGDDSVGGSVGSARRGSVGSVGSVAVGSSSV